MEMLEYIEHFNVKQRSVLTYNTVNKPRISQKCDLTHPTGICRRLYLWPNFITWKNMSQHFPENQTKQPNILQFHPLSDLEWLLMFKNKCFTLFKVIWLPVRTVLWPCFSHSNIQILFRPSRKEFTRETYKMCWRLLHKHGIPSTSKLHKIIQTHGNHE